MTRHRRLFRHIHLTHPIAGLADKFRRDREQYVLDIAEEHLGYAGRMISASKTRYVKLFPDHFPVFNANVCIDPGRKVWFGDLDLTADEKDLAALACALNKKVYVLYERDGRFGGRDQKPLLERAVFTVTPRGVSELGAGLVRDSDGRLRPATGRS